MVVAAGLVLAGSHSHQTVEYLVLQSGGCDQNKILQNTYFTVRLYLAFTVNTLCVCSVSCCEGLYSLTEIR